MSDILNGAGVAEEGAAAILKHCSVRDQPGLYVLGSYEERVTIHSQQNRGLNLIYALKTAGEWKDGMNVAIVGAGIAGMTAAMAAFHVKANVTIFERHSEVLHNLRGCHTRDLHPNIYDWPDDVHKNVETDLPFLNWKADSADNIAKRLLSEWDTCVGEDKIRVRAGVRLKVREHSDKGRRITVLAPQLEELDFDLVILSVGFGLERNVPEQPLRSYWRDDALHQPEIEWQEGRTQYLVSGNGDGGLIDLLRLRVRDFQQEKLIDHFKLEELSGELQKDLLSIEANMGRNAHPARYLFEQYFSKLTVPPEFDKNLRKLLRKDTQVTFNFQDWAFTPNSSILHRFLVSRLLKNDKHTTALPGTLLEIKGHEPVLVAHFELNGAEITRTFNRAVVRHGPTSALAQEFPTLHDVFKGTLGPRNALDGTRRPLWPKDFYGNFSEAGVVQAAANVVVKSSVTASATGVSFEAVQLKDALVGGDARALDSKFNMLQPHDQHWVRQQVIENAHVNVVALKGLTQLLDAEPGDSSSLISTMTSLVREALFSDSLARKVAILQMGTKYLALVERPVLEGFFKDLIEIIEHDRFEQVNELMPVLVHVQEVIPEELHMQYFSILLVQARSQAFKGKPAAQAGLQALPHAIALTALSRFDPAWGTNQYDASVLKGLVSKYPSAKVPPGYEEQVKDLGQMDYTEYYGKYHEGHV
jgi:hypothetical protein